ncbi:hypothetical protein [Paracidovorax avenae]|uniref:hypothetical protein n=1 Tax=Paracidovorax avenae TaxID=80867 RepID=UPI000D21765F|nr:hypothetical protein [Paracidovorax avenae]AVS96512.1 hypothetical protein C8232_09815 [Paracidovorax avenae]AVT10338.1 hypothetical protein C8242_13275 [Paracidovorax avenae]
MSSPLRIALVGEGPTEREVIEAALRHILAPRTFVLTQLQPEATKPDMGTGWGGVLKWCQQQATRSKPNGGPIDEDPTLSNFDCIVIQLDADVATFSYADLRPPYTDADAVSKGWRPLPCPVHSPPAPLQSDDLHAVLLAWLQPAVPGSKTIVCIPAMNTGAWQAAAKLPDDHALLADLECNLRIEPQMASLPIKLRVDKKKRASRLAAADAVAKHWNSVTAMCTRAQAFEQAMLLAFPVIAAPSGPTG